MHEIGKVLTNYTLGERGEERGREEECSDTATGTKSRAINDMQKQCLKVREKKNVCINENER
jgi:hypothetical protein